MNTNLKRCLLPDFTNMFVYFTPCLINHFLNAGWVNPAILNKLLQCNPSGFTPDWIESG